MLDGIFAFESTRQRHRAGPLLQERETLLLAMMKQGTSAQRLRCIAAMLLHVLRIMEMPTLRIVDAAEVQQGGERWAAQTKYRNKNGQKNVPEFFIYVALKLFRFHGVLREIDSRVEPDETYIEQFVHHISFVRGLAPATVQTSRRRVGAFLKWNTGHQRVLGAVSMNEIDEYLNSKRKIGYLPRSISSICSALRLFFVFAEREGWNTRRVASGIRRPRIPRYDAVPKGPEWLEVRRMVEHDFGSTAPDLRGDAIVAISAIYALRNSEIIRLRISDFDWMNEILTVKRAKSHKVQQFPIAIEAGEKILRYLKDSRPKCACRNLFVTIKPPYRPVDQASLWVVISSRMKCLGIESKHYGAHAIRHACATRLLHAGSSLPEIAQFLGHSDLQSVSIYAKHDSEALRQVASMSLAAVL